MSDAEWFLQKLRRGVADKKAAGAGMTEIAYHCGVSVTIMYDYLKGKSVPRLESFVAMGRYFGWESPFEEHDAEGADSRWFTQTRPDLRERVTV